MSAESLRARLKAKLKKIPASSQVAIDTQPPKLKVPAVETIEEQLIRYKISEIKSGVPERIAKALQVNFVDPVVFQYAIDNVEVTEIAAWRTILEEAPKEVISNAIKKYIKISESTNDRSVVFWAAENKNISDEDFNVVLGEIKTNTDAEVLLAKIPVGLSLDRAFLLAKILISSYNEVDFSQDTHSSLTLSLALTLLYFIPNKQMGAAEYEMLYINSGVAKWAANKSVQEVFGFATFLASCANQMGDEFPVKKNAWRRIGTLTLLPSVQIR